MPQSILGRIGQLIQANVNALIDSAEDPEKMLDQIIRDYTRSVADAEQAAAVTVGNLRLLEDDYREASDAVHEWGQKALAASRKADELRAGGQSAEADRFDGLARVALQRQLGYEEQARTLQTQVSQQSQLTTQLKQGLDALRAKREELVQRRNQLVSRSRMAGARVQLQTALQNASVMDPSSEISRFEERVQREEAYAAGLEEVSTDTIDAQFAQLEAQDNDEEVESRFAQLKADSGRPPLQRAG